MYTFDLAKDHSDQLRLKHSDVMLTVGMGEVISVGLLSTCRSSSFVLKSSSVSA